MSKLITKKVLDVRNLDLGEHQPLMVVKYLAILMEKLPESEAMAHCSAIFMLSLTEIRKIWADREKILRSSKADFDLSSTMLQYKLHAIYQNTVNALLGKDLANESIKSLLNVLRTVSSGLRDLQQSNLTFNMAGDNNSVLNVGDGGSVIVVPMPDSANKGVVNLGGRLVDNSIIESNIVDPVIDPVDLVEPAEDELEDYIVTPHEPKYKEATRVKKPKLKPTPKAKTLPTKVDYFPNTDPADEGELISFEDFLRKSGLDTNPLGEQ